MIKFDQIYAPLLKMLSVGGKPATKRKRKLKFKVTAKRGTVVSKHYTKRAATKKAKSIRGGYAAPIGARTRRTKSKRKVSTGYKKIGYKQRRYVSGTRSTF